MTHSKEPAIVETDWLTPEETMRELSIKQRTLQEWAQEGFLHFQRRKNPGHRPMRVYAAADVARLKANGGPPHRRQETGQRRPRRAQQQYLPPAAAALPGAAPPPRLWLTLEEAAAYSGLSEGFLLSKIQEGRLEAVKGGLNGAWRIRRVSLEQYPRQEREAWRELAERVKRLEQP